MAKIFLDAENTQMGRIASFTAKRALLGDEIAILNTEKAVITGNKESNIERLKLKRDLNNIKPRKGPFYSKLPIKIMKRAVRGMLPDFRLGRGKEALKRVKCYEGIPVEFVKEKLMKLETNMPHKKMTLRELESRA